MPAVEHHTLTPPELARRWRVKPERVIAWIRSGELRAFDVSSRPGVGKPRYRIPEDAIVEFQQRRSANPVRTPPRRGNRGETRCLVDRY